MSKTWNLNRFVSREAEPSLTRPTGSTKPSSQAVIEIGCFRIDTLGRTASLGGEALYLNPEEFDALVFLTRHLQGVVTPHTMLATIWTPDRPQQTEFLKTLLSLRKKIEAAASGKRYLRTEPWVVYRFNPNPSDMG
jgi:two-component system, OmpR family, KDP operon response regulator KdpE